MSTVQQLLKAVHQKTVYNVSPDRTIFEVMEIMDDKNIGALLVMDGDNLVGVVSERDVARRVVLDPKITSGSEVSLIMTRDPSVVTPFAVLEDVEALMKEKNVRHLPVVHEGKVVGVVSMKDILVITRTDQELLAQSYDTHYLRAR